MWNDDRFLDVCTSSERVRDAWVRQRRRSRVLQTVFGLVGSCIGVWLLAHAEPSGVWGLFTGMLGIVSALQTTMEIRLLRLVGLMNSRRPA